MQLKNIFHFLFYLTVGSLVTACGEKEETNIKKINVAGTYNSTVITHYWDASPNPANRSDTNVMDVILKRTSDSTYYFSLWTTSGFTLDQNVSKPDSIVLYGMRGYPYNEWLLVKGNSISGQSRYDGKIRGTWQQLTGTKLR